MSTYYYCDNQNPELVLLRNGSSVQIRPVCKTDSRLEKQMFEGLSPETRRDRFLAGNCKANDKLVELLTENDHQFHEAFIALVNKGGRDCAVAVAHYALDDSGRGCESAVVVSDGWQGKGLGKLMLQHLISSARAQGLDSIYSIEAADNRRAKGFAAVMNFECEADPQDYTLLTYRLDLKPHCLPNLAGVNKHASLAGRGDCRG